MANVSILMQTCDALAENSERLRNAHRWAVEYGWESPPAEDQATLWKAAEQLDRFRFKLLQFARGAE